VGDWGLHRERSMQAAWNRRIDAWSLGLPDAVLCDTWAHGRLFERLGAERARLHRVPVGAEDVFFRVPPPGSGRVEIVYAGGFLPLHGVPVVIEALARLERDGAGLPDYRVRLVGKGIDFERARELAAAVGLRRTTLEGPRPYAELPDLLASAHIVLGAFGTTDKAGRVIPHKVWQGLAAGRAVVTGDGEGLRELFEPGRDLVAGPRGDAAAMAAALARLVAEPELRGRLGPAGRERAAGLGTPQRLGAELRAILERLAEAG
jgi:glycosyltransferase involved in cell wall biosynthesis